MAPLRDDPFIAKMNQLPISPETKKSYTYKVGAAMDACNVDTFESLARYPDASIKMLESKYPKNSTLKQTVTSVLTTIAADKEWCLENEDCQRKWREYHAKLAKETSRSGPKEMDDASLMEKYVCWPKIVHASQRACRSSVRHDTLETSMETVFLAMITMLPPKRSDFGSMRVLHADAGLSRTPKNYVQLGPGPAVFIVIGEHKTSKSHGELVEKAPVKLANQIKASLERWPREYLFVTGAGNPMSSNSYGAFVKKTMIKYVGKPIGTTMIRHIFISDVVAHLESASEKKTVAARMLHSVSEQKGYVIKRTNGSDVCAPAV